MNSERKLLYYDLLATMTPPKSIRRYFSRLGKLGGSRPKHYTPEEIERRKQRLALARQQKQSTNPCKPS
jgi:hypothetical protein